MPYGGHVMGIVLLYGPCIYKCKINASLAATTHTPTLGVCILHKDIIGMQSESSFA